MRYSLIGSITIISILLGTSIFGIITGDIAFAQTSSDGEKKTVVSITDQLLDALVGEIILAIGGFFAIGLKAVFKWLRSKGVDITIQQEEAFTNLLTKRFEMLAKSSWVKMRNEPEKLETYWNELKTGHIPKELQDTLRKEGLDFAIKLKEDDQFKDFAKKLGKDSLDKLLKTARTNLKSDYQRRMLDVLPNLASVAIDAAFDPNVNDAESWAKNASNNMRSLMFSAEAVDNQNNIMLILKAEANKRLQARLNV